MKSMGQLKYELVQHCEQERLRTGSAWPIAVPMFPGVLIPFNSQQELDAYIRKEGALIRRCLIVGSLILVCLIAALWSGIL